MEKYRSALLAGLLVLLLVAISPTGKAAAIPGRGRLSGTVEAPKPFQAAQVYARHKEKDIIFMVYTNKGSYKTVNMFPGSYEVWVVEKEGFHSGIQTVEIEPGKNATVHFTLQEGDPPQRPQQQYGDGRGMGRPQTQPISEHPYNEVFPNEPGRRLVEQSCFVCHGENFISRNPRSREAWQGAINLMIGKAPGMERWGTPLMDPNKFRAEEWETLLNYLTKNFGTDAPRRSVIPENRRPMPLDEEHPLAGVSFIGRP